MTDLAQYTLRAEARAVEGGRHAIALGDGRYKVLSETHDGVHYVLEPRLVDGQPLKVRCTCPSGLARSLPIPCKHAALVARRLEREGRVEWRDGLWHVGETRPAVDVSMDPFAGLEPTRDAADAIAELAHPIDKPLVIDDEKVPY